MKTIGICIPTYKRPDFLRRCLASIIDQADGLPVQIFVASIRPAKVDCRQLSQSNSRLPWMSLNRPRTQVTIMWRARNSASV